ncbi:putative component of NuA3 histone acetyltransferase complex [Coemansia sp. RSA 989]|nr:Oxoglutarate and iron-dependent oxygenase degradation C-term-domain-containing protein [Coemansia mojavensis]KAJ1739659.1 putative component of NuA3 histone acetyltransferase complex [Coemansia sp. RSA 1086]KAJ1748089.1 putative component of NuA3 histone acetyltransferase complex [Coemansia sp. RSA 1821]KAJ1862286.1 putative component of NuA3 histone acetyltransferase complex [Coemansia sp. RSA 989]KAJ1870077.1 putative component of NuA3 histone acetyltransferase complex [Coemansia sp. RSA 9
MTTLVEKRARIDDAGSTPGRVQLNRGYFDEQFISKFRQAFTDQSLEHSLDISVDKSSCCHGEITAQPFHTGRLHEIFSREFLRSLKDELGQLTWHERSNDLYSFFQTDDLALNGNANIKALRDYLSGEEFVGFMEQITGVQLTRGYLDLAAQRYKATNHLLCHDDDVQRGKLTRKIAYIIYLTEEWAESDGGALGLFAANDDGHPANVVTRMLPKFNSIGFFLTGQGSFHTVEEVYNGERWSVTGWFYGPVDDTEEAVEPTPLSSSVIAQPQPLLESAAELSKWINPDYLQADTQSRIQEAFLEQSSMELCGFICPQAFSTIESELNDSMWVQAHERGPAHLRSYLELDPDAAPTLSKLLEFLRSKAFAEFLTASTSLELSQVSQQVRRFDRGHYTLIHDQALEPLGLDVVLSLAPGKWDDGWGGTMHYIADKDELLQISPKANSLSLVMRDEGTLRFVKYLNHTAEASRQEVSMVFIEKE